MMDPARFGKFPLHVQLGHIASEVSRARVWAQKGEKGYSRGAIDRAIELVSLSEGAAMAPSWKKEFGRVKETLEQFSDEPGTLDVGLAELEEYLTRIVASSGEE